MTISIIEHYLLCAFLAVWTIFGLLFAGSMAVAFFSKEGRDMLRGRPPRKSADWWKDEE